MIRSESHLTPTSLTRLIVPLLLSLLAGCHTASRQYTPSTQTPQHDLPLYVMEVFHSRLNATCEKEWVGCEFQGGLTATTQFRVEVPDNLWYWEIYRYTFARPATEEHDELSEAGRARKRGIKLAAVINLDDPQDNYSKPLTLRIAGWPLTLYVGGLDEVMPPHERRPTPLSIRQLLTSLDDRNWSLKTYSEKLDNKLKMERGEDRRKATTQATRP